MKPLTPQPNLVEKVRAALLEAIASGALAPGERVIQERVAEQLGVSRQPVQQALTLLLSQGILKDAPGRRLVVAPLDPDYIRHMYDMRAAVEGLAFREAARLGAEQAARQGPALIEQGREASAAGNVARMIEADRRFHGFIMDLCGNPLVPHALAPHLTYMQRVSGHVLQRDNTRTGLWDEHERMLDAVIRGDGALAETLVRAHIDGAARFVLQRL